MRYSIGTVSASLMVVGSLTLAAAPAFAGADEAQMDSFIASQAGSGQAAPHQYMKMDPRDAKVDKKADADVDTADATNPYFNHAEGTMSDPEALAETTPPVGTSNGQYVATYHQPYMQVDPADTKVGSGASSNVDSSNPYFYHAQGTMGMP